jgi:hypothetical protein
MLNYQMVQLADGSSTSGQGPRLSWQRHSGRPAFRRPSSILARSDGRSGIA